MLFPHARTKHIDVKIHFVREALSNGSTELIYCPTEQMVTDLLTKPISHDRFEALRLKVALGDLQSVSQFKWECCRSKLTGHI